MITLRRHTSPVAPKAHAPKVKKNQLTDEELDHTALTIGQYRGQTPSQIAEHDPSYLVWLAEQSKERIASDLLIDDCRKDIE